MVVAMRIDGEKHIDNLKVARGQKAEGGEGEWVAVCERVATVGRGGGEENRGGGGGDGKGDAHAPPLAFSCLTVIKCPDASLQLCIYPFTPIVIGRGYRSRGIGLGGVGPRRPTSSASGGGGSGPTSTPDESWRGAKHAASQFLQ